MAQFDTDHILTIIIGDALRDHEANRQVIEALEGFRLGNQDAVLATVLEVMLAEIELTAAGFEPDEIEATIQEFPEDFGPEVMLARRRGPTRQELDEGGAI